MNRPLECPEPERERERPLELDHGYIRSLISAASDLLVEDDVHRCWDRGRREIQREERLAEIEVALARLLGGMTVREYLARHSASRG